MCKSMNLKHVLATIPQVREWVEATLAQQQAQARPVASLGFPRLPQYFSPETLAGTFVVELPRVPVPPLVEMGLPEFMEFQKVACEGITYLDTYFVRMDKRLDEALHFHELVHVLQWRHLGPDQFLAAYAVSHLLAAGYERNLLEVMAYHLLAQLSAGELNGNVESLIRGQIDRHRRNA